MSKAQEEEAAEGEQGIARQEPMKREKGSDSKRLPASPPEGSRAAQPRPRKGTMGAPFPAGGQSRNPVAKKRPKIPRSVLSEVDPVGAAILNVYSPGIVPTRPFCQEYPGAFRAAVEAALSRSQEDDELRDALASILDVRMMVSQVISAKTSQSGSRTRQDALNKVLQELLVRTPTMSEKEVLEALELLARDGHDVVEEIIDEDSSQYVLWKTGTGRTKRTPVTGLNNGLKNRVSRIRRTLSTLPPPRPSNRA